MTANVRCFDASLAIPQVAPEGCGAVLGYIGMPPGPDRLDEAEHVWTRGQWRWFGHLRQFPAWVARPSSPAYASGLAAAAEAKSLGWRRTRAIVADMETLDDPAWWNQWAAAVDHEGYLPVWYGSLEFAGKYDAKWKWLALYDDVADVPEGFAAKQYAADVRVPGGEVDLSMVTPALMEHGGVGKRRLF